MDIIQFVSLFGCIKNKENSVSSLFVFIDIANELWAIALWIWNYKRSCRMPSVDCRLNYGFGFGIRNFGWLFCYPLSFFGNLFLQNNFNFNFNLLTHNRFPHSISICQSEFHFVDLINESELFYVLDTNLTFSICNGITIPMLQFMHDRQHSWLENYYERWDGNRKRILQWNKCNSKNPPERNIEFDC